MSRFSRFIARTPLFGPIDAVRSYLRRTGKMLGTLDPNLKYMTMMRQEQFYAALKQTPRYTEPKRLLQADHQVFSQHGEDGILQEIFRRIGSTDRFFAEVGVEDGLENNTVYLVQQGWRGVWIDGDPKFLAFARREFQAVTDAGRLKIIEAFVSGRNIASIFKEAGVPEEFDLLSLDIDRNTYFLWDALRHLRPRVVVIEYNPAIPPSDDWCVDDNPDAMWDGSSSYYGASLKRYEILGTELGYCLVGCDVSGANAFFVRKDLVADKFCEPFTSENHYEPPRYFLTRYHSFPHSRRFSDAKH